MIWVKSQCYDERLLGGEPASLKPNADSKVNIC